MKRYLPKRRNNLGFTLIELLIVIAVIGILAAVVLVAIDPLEQLQRGRDSGRKSTLGQLGNSLQAFTTSRQGAFPNAGPGWLTELVDAGEIKKTPPDPQSSGLKCGLNSVNGWCYTTAGGEAVVFVRLNSKSEISKCATVGNNAYFRFDSGVGNACLVCAGGDLGLGTTCNATQ